MNTRNEKGKVVLIVDDSPDTLGMLNEALETENMTTLVALEGRQAISIAKKMTPDIILLDAIMPHMDGFETCETIKADAELKNIPVIFMTGLSDTESVVKGLRVGGVDYLTKPICPDELIARINVHLQNARATTSAQQALDTAGQTIIAVNKDGERLWSTPSANRLLNNVEKDGLWCVMSSQISEWLTHQPIKGNKLYFQNGDESTGGGTLKKTAVYFATSENGEHLIRLIDDDDNEGMTILRDSFFITKRESEVLFWIAKGKTNRETGKILEMSPRTVNKHLEQLYKKMDVDNRTSAAALAIQALQRQVLV